MMKRYFLIVLVAMLGLVVAAPAPASTTAIPPAKAHIAKKKKKCKKGKVRKKGKCVKKKTGMNHPPAFPDPLPYDWDIRLAYYQPGELAEAHHTIILRRPASDPDGDRLIYKWTATLGPIYELCPDPAYCLVGIWTTPAVLGKLLPADATLTVSDGRGGSDAVTFAFRPE